MSSERWQRLRAVYDAIADAPPADRNRLLEKLCGEDAALRAEVEAMLAADETPHAWLDDSLAAFIAGAFRPGDVLCERFELMRVAGRGGMGEVWAAHDRKLGHDIALKTIAATFMTGEQALARFTQEVKLARRVNHRNVCRVHDLLEDRSGPAPRVFLTMELLEGQTLGALLARDGRLPAPQSLWIFRELLEGLSAAHAEGVVHRDLKPANVMLVPGAESPRVVIMDFGLARTTVPGDAPSGASSAHAPVGTPEYMAPEQLSGRAVAPATDIYALGLVLFEMLSGAPPFRSATTLESIMRRAREAPRRLHGEIAGVTLQVDAVIARALAFEPADRFATVADVIAALDGPPKPRTTIALPSRRVMVAAGVVGLALAGTGMVYLWRSAPRGVPPAAAVQWLDATQRSLAEGAMVRARDDAKRAVAAAPAYAPAHAALAETLLELEMPGRATEAMLNASVAAPDRSALPADQQDYVAGVQALLVRDCDRAMAHFEARSALPSQDRPLRLMTTARAYERCDRPKDADRTLKAAAELDPRNPAVPLRRARLLARDAKVDDAMAAFALAESLFRDRNNLEGVAEVFASRGAVEITGNRLEEADATLAKGAGIATSAGDVRQQIRIALWQAVLRRRQNRMSEAIALTTQATDLASRSDLEAVALDGLFAAGNVHMGVGQFEEARGLFARALTIAEANRHEAQRARGRLSLATAYVRLADPERALQAIADARPYFLRIGHRANMRIADTLEAQARMMRGEYALCIDLYTQQLAAAREARDIVGEARGQENLATALTAAGRLREAAAAYRAALRLREANRSEPRPLFYVRLNIVETLSKLGAFAEADAMLPSVPAAKEPELESRRASVIAAHLFRQGRYAPAATEADRAMRLAASLPERRMHVAVLACAIHAYRGAHPTAAQRCREASDILGTSGHAMLRLDIALTSAQAAVARRDAVAARAHVDEATRFMGGEPRDDGWRLPALGAAVDTLEQRPADADRAALSRELERLRLQWGEQDFAAWQRRADVRWLLATAGSSQGGAQR